MIKIKIMKTGKLLLTGIAAGLLASYLKSLAEPPLQKAGLKLFPSTGAELELKGADLEGHPEKMPPAILVKKVFKHFTGSELKDSEAKKCMSYIHYGLGALIGLTYVAARKKDKKVSILQGFPAGAAMFAFTHGSVVPALGLQGSLKKMPKSWWVWEFGSHVLFGFFIEQSSRLFKKIF